MTCVGRLSKTTEPYITAENKDYLEVLLLSDRARTWVQKEPPHFWIGYRASVNFDTEIQERKTWELHLTWQNVRN